MHSSPHVSLASSRQLIDKLRAPIIHAFNLHLQSIVENPIDENNIDEVMEDFEGYARALFGTEPEDDIFDFDGEDEEDLVEDTGEVNLGLSTDTMYDKAIRLVKYSRQIGLRVPSNLPEEIQNMSITAGRGNFGIQYA